MTFYFTTYVSTVCIQRVLDICRSKLSESKWFVIAYICRCFNMCKSINNPSYGAQKSHRELTHTGTCIYDCRCTRISSLYLIIWSSYVVLGYTMPYMCTNNKLSLYKWFGAGNRLSHIQVLTYIPYKTFIHRYFRTKTGSLAILADACPL